MFFPELVILRMCYISTSFNIKFREGYIKLEFIIFSLECILILQTNHKYLFCVNTSDYYKEEPNFLVKDPDFGNVWFPGMEDLKSLSSTLLSICNKDIFLGNLFATLYIIVALSKLFIVIVIFNIL